MRKRLSGSSQPPWEVLVLVASHLDPKTLAFSSCVSKSWSVCMSSDHLWEPILSANFPSLSSLRTSPSSAVPFCRLYALGRVSADHRLRKPSKPILCLNDLVFSVSVHDGNSHIFTTVVKPGSELGSGANGVFRFDFDVCGENFVAVDGLRVTWNVVLEGYKGVFTMMDCCKGKPGFVGGSDGWFMEELPPPGCCSGGGRIGGGLVADMRLGLRADEGGSGGGGGGGKVVVEKVGVGMLNVTCWRYLSVDDALRYLQHFLMPYEV